MKILNRNIRKVPVERLWWSQKHRRSFLSKKSNFPWAWTAAQVKIFHMPYNKNTKKIFWTKFKRSELKIKVENKVRSITIFTNLLLLKPMDFIRFLRTFNVKILLNEWWIMTNEGILSRKSILTVDY